MPTATDIVWETYPQCPINNTLVVRDALTALSNVSVFLFTHLSRSTQGSSYAWLLICLSFRWCLSLMICNMTQNTVDQYGGREQEDLSQRKRAR